MADWWEHRIYEPQEACLMVAIRRDDVASLNRLARARMAAGGALGDDVVIGGVAWAVGDEVVGLRNEARIGIRNGSRGVVVGFDKDDSSIKIRIGAGVHLVVPPSYVEAGDLALGYALTLHKAQGATVDRAFLLGSDALYREAAYVGLSRARQRCDLYAVAGADGPAGPEPFSALVARLGRSGAQELASAGVPDSLARLGPERDALARAVSARREGERDVGTELERIDAEVSCLRAGLEGPFGLWATRRVEELEAERAGMVAAQGEHRASGAAVEKRKEHLGVLCAEMGRRVGLLGQAATLGPPEVVSEALGPVPGSHGARRAWRAGAEAILASRERWGIEGPDVLGESAASALQRAERAAAERAVTAATRRLGRDVAHGMEIG